MLRQIFDGDSLLPSTAQNKSDRIVRVELPPLHEGQPRAFQQRSRFYALRCGRRWGKSTFGVIIACDGAAHGELIGYFAPDYKRLTEIKLEAANILRPIRQFPSGGSDIIRTTTGGCIDFWTLEDVHAGRSRKYHKVIIDEAAFAKPNMMDIFEKSIKPTLLDFRGDAVVLSNTNGAVPDQFFWQICNEDKHGFTQYHAPSHQNPLLPREDLEKWAKTMHPLVYQQEILAEFVDWSGVAFFSLDNLLGPDRQGIDPRVPLDGVFAVIDTAMKSGKENDGTAVIYFGVSKIFEPALVILDWDIVQIEGAMLEHWLPSVFVHLEALAKTTRALHGSQGAWIEDRGAGTVLLQQAMNRNWQAHAIPETLTALGKDERALNVSGHVYTGILDCTKRGGLILDPFAGSGSTLIAAQKTGRRGYGLEIDSYYIDTAIRRFKAVYDIDAFLADGGSSFEQVSSERAAVRVPTDG